MSGLRPKALPSLWLDKLVQAVVEGDTDVVLHILEEQHGEDVRLCTKLARMRLERRAA